MPAQIELEPALAQEPWERLAAERLAELLPHSQLEKSLGKLLRIVRQSRRRADGVDRRGTKLELANAVLLQRGIDLLASKTLRDEVAAACGIDSPRCWHPGKKTAIAFVKATGFPAELAGLPNGERLLDVEYLEPRFRLNPLLPFQREVKRKLSQTLRTVGGRGNLTLPTGAGKTRVAVEAIREWLADVNDRIPQFAPGRTVIWLAHTEELCEQAFACFKQVWQASPSATPLHLIRFFGSYSTKLANSDFDLRHFLSNPSVLVSTPQRLINELNRPGESTRLGKSLRYALGALFIDEAHRAGAPTYRQIMNLLQTDLSPAPLIGLTATPFCKEYLDKPDAGTQELQLIFKELLEPSITLGPFPRQALEKGNVLAVPDPISIKTNISIRLDASETPTHLDESAIESVDQKLAEIATQSNDRRFAIRDYVLPIARDEQHSILYFGPSVDDAEAMAYLLKDEGVSAAVISGKTKPSARREIIRRFRAGRLRVLCNCEVLTVGFDAPNITHLVMARPTVSRVLYEQIIGRGLRGPLFGGTKSCRIIDCEDDYPDGRPELGYQAFRRIWKCEEEAARQSEARDIHAAFSFSPSSSGQRLAKGAARRLAYLEKLNAMLHAEFGPLNGH